MNATHNLQPDSIKAYSKAGLGVYDPLIMGLLVRHVWGCDSSVLVDHYRRHITSNHADIGVGTAYCLDECGFAPGGFAPGGHAAPDPRIALIDLQPNCLRYAAERLARYRPERYVRDVLHPVEDIPGPRFDSIALGGILHCLSGDLTRKSVVFDNITSLTQGGTKIFGYSLVRDEVDGRASRRITHEFLNRIRVIDNRNDWLKDLERQLSRRFINCHVKLVGCMALFSAVVPHTNQATTDQVIAVPRTRTGSSDNQQAARATRTDDRLAHRLLNPSN
jgi:hypothetical protein